MLAEHRLHPSDLILPLFVCEGSGCEEPIGSLRGVSRWSVDRIAERAKDAAKLGIPCVALFPNTPREPAHRRREGSAQPRQSHLPRDQGDQGCGAGDRRADRRRARSLYGHGHDGLVDERGYVINDDTVAVLAEQALVQAAGRRRHRRSVGHDGRPRRRDPPGARGGGPLRRRDHGLCRQICLGLLRPVPRRGRLGRAC